MAESNAKLLHKFDINHSDDFIHHYKHYFNTSMHNILKYTGIYDDFFYLLISPKRWKEISMCAIPDD